MTDLGRFTNIPDHIYFDERAIGGSTLARIATSTMAHWLASRGEPPTPAMLLGTYAHAATLEPARFERDWVVARQTQCVAITKKGDQCSNQSVPGADTCHLHGGNIAASIWLQTLGLGIKVISETDRNQALAIAEGIRAGLRRLGYPDLLSRGEVEVTYRAVASPVYNLKDEAVGFELSLDPSAIPGPNDEHAVLVHGRIDLELPGAIVDLKGTQFRYLSNARKWAWHCLQLGYDVQAALYTGLYRAVHGKIPAWSWIAHEQAEPYSVRVFDADTSLLDLGRRRVGVALHRLLQYRRIGDAWCGWPKLRETVMSPLEEE